MSVNYFSSVANSDAALYRYRMGETRKWIAAIFLAALGRFSWRRPWTVLKPGVAILMSLLPFTKVAPAIYDRRMASCRSCPVFWRPLATCGSPLADDPKLGCHCYLTRKNQLPEATCWARDKRPELNIGWTNNLMYD